MIKDLTDKRLGYDFQKDKPYDWAKLAKREDKTKGIEKYWLADHLSKNLGDIMKIKSLPETDMLFYSSPCTDYSAAGKQEGGDWTCLDCDKKYNPLNYNVSERYICPHCGSHNIKSTRSGLLFEVERLLVDYQSRDCLPKYLCLENVAALVSKKFIKDFEAWVDRLDNLGYNTYWQIINAKDTGTPQSRERVFALSIRKDMDNGKFEFPKPFGSGVRLRDVLEDDINVISKYFLSDEVQDRLKITNPKFDTNIIGTTKPDFRTIGERDVVYQKDGIVGCLMASDYKQPKQLYVGETENKPIQSGILMGKYEKMMDVSRRVYDENGIAPTLHTCGGGNTEPKVSRNNLKVVRKLTPKECFRLQAFDDIDYERCKEVGMSDTQGYKATGNSICVSALKLLFEHLYKAQYDENYKCLDEEILEYQEEMKHAPNYAPDITRVGNVSTNNSQGGAVYGIYGVSQTICAGPHGYGTGNIYDNREIYSAASRGRNNEDGGYDQHLEINNTDYSNALTTVPKDNLVVEVENENFMNLPVE
jgi:DNA-cytosine methyltransferase